MTDERSQNPYVGLRPFFEDDSLFFFGRRVHTTAVLEALHDARFLAVVGSSGCGKSSLIRAGVIPALKAGFLVQEQDRWSIVRMRPGTAPLSNLAAGLSEAVSSRQAQDATHDLSEAVRLDHADAVLDFIRQRAEGTNVLLLVDQFEEVFANWRDPDAPHPEDRDGQIRVAKRKAEATDFVDILLRLADQAELPIYVVLTMRTDYLGDCDVFRGLPEALNRGRYLVPRLTPEQVREAIVGPARLSGAQVAPRLLDELLNQLGDRFDQLPVLQHALQRTWAEWDRRGRDGPIDLVHFRAVGGLEDALSRDADDALAGFDETVAAAVFKRLTATDAEQRRIRSRARLSELVAVSGASRKTVEELIERFRGSGRNFLFVSADGKPDDPVVDISHESLIRQWRKLRDWVDEECGARDRFRELQDRARRFDRGETAVLRDPDLSIAVSWQERFRPADPWAARYGGSLPLVTRYITESRTADRRRRRTRNGLVLGAGIAAVAITVIFGILRRATLAAQVDAAAERIRADSAEIAGLTAQVEALGASNEDLTAYVGVLTGKNNELRFESASLDADIDSLTRVIPFLRGDVARLEADVARLRKESDSLEVRMNELAVATFSVRGSIGQLQRVVATLERDEREQRSTFERLTSEARTLGLLAQPRAPFADNASFPAPTVLSSSSTFVPPLWRVERLRVVVDSLRFENESLRERIRILIASNDSIAARIEEQRAERAVLEDTVNSLRSELARLGQEKQDLEVQLASLRVRINSAEERLSQDSTELRSLQSREGWLSDAIPRLATSNATLRELLGHAANSAPGHRFASLVVAEREQPIAAGVLATTMFAMAPGTATGPNDPRVVGALRVALSGLGGVATTYLAAPPGGTAVAVSREGRSIVRARTDGSFDSIPMPVPFAATGNPGNGGAAGDGATMTVSPDGRWIAVAGTGGLRLYEGPAHRPGTVQVPAAISQASSAAFLADGRLLVARLNGAAIWSVGGAAVTSAGFCTGSVTVVATAANAPLAACGSDAGIVELWRSDTRQRVAVLPHACRSAFTTDIQQNEECMASLSDLRLSDDGHRIAALDDDGLIRVWAWNESMESRPGSVDSVPAALVINGAPERLPVALDDFVGIDPVSSIAFTPNGDRLVALTSVGTLAIHVISAELLAAEICRRLPAGSAPACGARVP